MRLLAARSEVAAPWALPRGSHSPPLAWAAKMALVSSTHLPDFIISRFFMACQGKTAESPRKVRKTHAKERCGKLCGKHVQTVENNVENSVENSVENAGRMVSPTPLSILCFLFQKNFLFLFLFHLHLLFH